MKKTLLTTVLVVSSGLLASAVTTATTRNFAGLTNGLPILDNAGNPISGSYAVGFYADDFDFTQDAPAVRSGLVQFGSELNTFVFPGLVGTPNSTQDNIPKEGGSQFSGKNIFVLFGDQSTLDSSTLVGVFKLNGQFQNENAADQGVALADVFPGNGELVFGNLVAPASQPTAPAAFNFAQGIQLVGVAVPEPSTGLLSALAGLALVARRRR
jgi:hypothetical protein